MRSKLNLASQTYVNRRAIYLFYAVVTALLLIVLTTQFRYLAQLQSQELLLQKRVAEIQTQLGLTSESAAGYSQTEFSDLLKQIEFSNDLILKDSFQWTGLLGQLEQVLPDDARIVDIRPNFKNSSLRISAQAKSVGGLRRFVDRLMASSDFTDVLLLSQSEQVLIGKSNAAEKVILFNLQFKGVLR